MADAPNPPAPPTSPTPTTNTTTTALTTTCHCGGISIQIPCRPPTLNECFCSICYKYGALWGYFKRGSVVVTTAAGTELQAYIRQDEGSDGDLAFNRCSRCGCVMFWCGVGEFAGLEHEMGVNCRMLPLGDVEGIERRVSRKP